MSLFTKLGNDIASPVDAAGNRRSVDNIDFQRWMTEVERMFSAFQAGGGVIFPNLGAANASLAYGANQMAWVFGDPVPGNNGVYRKVGASGSGSWVRLGDLPYSFIKATNAGAGTANAIIATSSIPIPAADGGALITVNVAAENTGAATIAFNGAAPLNIVSSSGNAMLAGYLKPGMQIAGFKVGSDFRLLTDIASASIVAAAEADADRAEAARDAAVAALSSVVAPKATLALAMADDPDVDPDYYDIAYFDTSYQTGSGAKWRKMVSDPGLVAGAAFQNANGAWYVNDSEWLKPEQFGRIGVDAATDTAAWVRLVAAANHRGGKLKVRVSNDLNLNGTGTATDSQTFTNFSSIWIRGADTEVYQRSSLSKTFKFKKAGGKVKVTGVEFVGYAEQQIDASQTPNEIDFDASSGNAVAAIYAEDLEEVDISRVTTRNHAGRDIDCRGVLKLKARDCELVGLGPVYNRPIQDGHQGNGEDAAIYFIPKVTAAGDPTHGTYYDPVTSTAYRAILDVCNCEIRWHSFCIRTILNKAIILHGNYFGETPGQHHVYDTDSDGHDIIGNVFEDCRLTGYKMQFENLPGFNYGKAWEPSKAYAVGDIVRAVSIVWRCKTAHTSGGSFSSTNWEQQERYLRRGGIWTGNQFKGCDQGIGIIESSQVDGRNIWSEGYNISGNYFAVIGTAIYIDRLWKAQIIGNTAHGGQFGIFGRNFCGSIRSNNFWDQTRNSVCISISKTTSFEDNGFFNFGSSGTGDDSRAAVLVYAPNAVTAPPVNSAQPRIFFTKNNISNFAIGGTAEAADAPGQYLVFDADTRNLWYIQDTYGTQTTKKFRIDGTIALQFRNHFINNGYANAAQNDATPGDIGTLLTALRAKFVVKNP